MSHPAVRHTYTALIHLGGFFSHFFLLLVRVYWGVLLALAGYGKFLSLTSTATFFGSLGFPFPTFTAGFVGVVEIVAGASLALGLASRFFSLITIILFTVAYATAHNDAVRELFNDPSQFTSAAPFLFYYTAFVVFCFGPGALSFDYWFERK
jgi:putative oxidoreductase